MGSRIISFFLATKEKLDCLRKLLLLCIVIIPILPSCSDSEAIHVDCDRLMIGMINRDDLLVNEEINLLTSDLVPAVTEEDIWGHRNNMDVLIERLNHRCGEMDFELFCYACLESSPPFSLIHVSIMFNDELIIREISVSTSEVDIL